MTTRLLLFFVALLGGFTPASAKSIDSLQTVLAKYQSQGNQLASCETYLQLTGEHFARGEYEKALAYADTGLLIVPNSRADLIHHFTYTQYMIYAQQWAAYPSEHIKLLDTALMHLEELDDQELLLGFRTYYAGQLYQQGQLEHAQKQYQLLEAFCASRENELDCSPTLRTVYSQQIGLQTALGNLDQALVYLDLARRQFKGQEVSEEMLNSYVAESALLARLGRAEEIQMVLNRGINRAKSALLDWYLGRFYRLKASYAIDVNSFQDSIDYWLGAADLHFKDKANPKDMMELDMARSRYFYTQGRFEQVVETLIPHMSQCSVDAPNTSFCRNACYFLTMCYDTLAFPTEALHYANLGVEMHKKYNDKALLRMSYELLGWLHFKQGNAEEAYYAMYDANAMANDVFREGLDEAIANERTRQQVAAVEAAKQAAETKAQLLTTQNRLWLGLSITFGLLLFGGSILLVLLQKAREKLKDSNHELTLLNATKDKFFGIIAHDLRSPIVALSGVGDQMQWHLEKGRMERVSRLANNIAETSKGLTRLLDNLLQWALLQTGMIPHQPTTIDLQVGIDENISLYANIASAKAINLRVNTEKNLKVYADPRAVATIIRNLLNNAIKFTNPGGHITLEARKSNQKVVLSLRDNGIGMSSKRLAELFQLERNSSRGTAGEKGAGLGLVLVRELAELNKIVLSVESEPQKGSCFTLVFG